MTESRPTPREVLQLIAGLQPTRNRFGKLEFIGYNANPVTEMLQRCKRTIPNADIPNGGEDYFDQLQMIARAVLLTVSASPIDHAEQGIEPQKRWIADHGGDLAGYIKRYGSKDEPGHCGDGGEAIYEADIAELQRRVTLRNPGRRVLARMSVSATRQQVEKWCVYQGDHRVSEHDTKAEAYSAL